MCGAGVTSAHCCFICREPVSGWMPSALQDLLQACGSTSPFADRSWVGVTQWDDGTCVKGSSLNQVSWMTKLVLRLGCWRGFSPLRQWWDLLDTTEDATSSNSFNLGVSENMRPQDPWGYHRFPCKNCGWISHFQVPHPHGGFLNVGPPKSSIKNQDSHGCTDFTIGTPSNLVISPLGKHLFQHPPYTELQPVDRDATHHGVGWRLLLAPWLHWRLGGSTEASGLLHEFYEDECGV